MEKKIFGVEEDEYDDGTTPTHDQRIQLCFDHDSLFKTYRNDPSQLHHVSSLFTEPHSLSSTKSVAVDDAPQAVRHTGDC